MPNDPVDGTNFATLEVTGTSADNGSQVTVQLFLQQAMNNTLEGRIWSLRHPSQTMYDTQGQWQRDLPTSGDVLVGMTYNRQTQVFELLGCPVGPATRFPFNDGQRGLSGSGQVLEKTSVLAPGPIRWTLTSSSVRG